jgi:SET domain-containing protein
MKPKFYWLNPKLEVKQSVKHGKGTFAKNDISKGERLLIFGGYIMTLKEEASLPKSYNDNGSQIAEDYSICTFSKKDLGGLNFFNHSCDPNAGFHGQIFLVAMRDIKKGEEVVLDYAMALCASKNADPYRMECKCGSKKCRGIITDNDWKIKVLQKRYKKHFQLYLLDKMQR